MRKSIPGILIIILSAGLLFLFSCTPGSCFEETESYLKAFFYNNTTKKLVAPDSLTVYGLNMESDKIYNKALRVQPALFPLNASSSDCMFIVKINGVVDTVKFRYTSYPHLISKECGYTIYHQLDTVREYSKNIIKDIYTGNKNITTLNEENIRIFY